MLLTGKYQRVSSASIQQCDPVPPVPKLHLGDHSNLLAGWSSPVVEAELPSPDLQPIPATHPQEMDPLYLFARHLAWEQEEEPSAAWDLLAAAQSSHDDTRAHARTLLASSRHFAALGQGSAPCRSARKRCSTMETTMNSPYGLELIDNCAECTATNPGFFCGFSSSASQSLNDVSHCSLLPAGAILFVEGQSPRGMFILCSGKVNLSTSSREGKILMLKSASAGEALGLSAAVSGIGYEVTAETATPCQVNFVERKHFLDLMETHSDVGVHTAQCLSRDFHSAYRDIHDLVLTRSSSGKLARLLLSHSPTLGVEAAETRVLAPMTHEEMAQRIGASRETVTRLLGSLKKKQLIRLDGATLVIRDRTALEALAV